MESKEIIELFVTIIPLVISLMAVWYSIKSLKITEQSIKDANRPYLSPYVDIVDTICFSKDLVIKNFGNSSAKILKINMVGVPGKLQKEINFQSLVGGSIAPKQKFMTSLDEDFNEMLYLNIVYQENSGKIYSENFTVKTDVNNSLVFTTHELNTDSNESTAIKQSAHAIIRAMK